MIYSDKEKNFIEKQYAREVWLGKRGIGGSDVGALMQVSKWQTFNDVFNRLLGKAKDKDDLAKKNKRVAEGQKAEKYIWNLYAIEHPDKKVVTAAINKVWLFFSNKNVRITVTPDALVQIGSGDDKEYTEGVEIKDVEVHSKKECINLEYVGIEENTIDEIVQKLNINFEKDVKVGYSTYGTHRDDIKVTVNNVDVRAFGSQGQQRTCALSMKLAELEIIKQDTSKLPILLLDDVLSELDDDRKIKLLKFCSKTQTLLTCTEFKFEVPCKKIIINNGNVK